MTATGDRRKAVAEVDVIIVTIAAQFARQALEEFKGLIPDQAVVVSLMKGIERSTDKRMDQVVMEALDLPADRFACLSGPNLSKEIALKQPAAAVVASSKEEVATRVAAIVSTEYFKILTSNDVIGVEMCGSLKNVVALALGVAAGAKAQTFFGLAGVGDLIATCGSPLSRNYTFGANLGKGMSVDEATKVSNGVAEGVPTTAAVVALGKKYGVETPLASAMLRVLNEGISCDQMLGEIFAEGIVAE